MNLKHIIKESLLNEVGEASKTPFRYKRNKDDFYYKDREKDSFDYKFTTKEKYVYEVNLEREYGRGWMGKPQTEEEWRSELASLYMDDRKLYINLMKLGATRDDLKGVWTIAFAISDYPEENDDNDVVETPKVEPKSEENHPNYEELNDASTNRTQYTFTRYGDVDMESIDDNNTNNNQGGYEMPTLEPSNYRRHRDKYDEPNAGEFYRIMSTIVKIVKNHLEKNGGRILTFSPLDDRRGRVFSHFIMRQLPGSKMWKEHNTFYFLLKL